MAETTKPSSGTLTSNTSTAGSAGGGARDTTNASSATANQSSTATTATPGSATPGSSSATSSTGGSGQGQRAQTANPSATTNPASAASSTSPQTAGSAGQGQRPGAGQQRQSYQGSQPQGHRSGERGERGGEERRAGLSGDAMSDAKKVGSELVGAARDSAVSLIDAQRARAAEQIAAVGDALRRSIESFETGGSSALAQYANQAADQISGFADAVRDRSWSDLANDLESFARRSPTLFMMSAVGLGFLAGRFLLSSSDRAHTAGEGGTGMSGTRAGQTLRDMGGVSRTVPTTGARAEYGSSTIRE